MVMISNGSEFLKCSRVSEVQQSFCLLCNKVFAVIQLHHASGPESICQKFVVHLSKLIMYGHVAFYLHKVKKFVANSVKLQDNFGHTKSNFCV